MELFLFISMALTIVTFSLIALSEPVPAPSFAEQNSDSANFDFVAEEGIEPVATSSLETVVPQVASMAM